ncbi:MAG: cation diffusion facilitator family transporter [Chloroflexi bacterium]|nr:cation diffusion facilitator family transporter [Chloroflexota bacterium]
MAGGRRGEVELAIIVALSANVIIAILKLVGAIDSNSSGMFAEAAHSFADSGNQLILLIGVRLALRPADRSHPFGYGKDRYFWTFFAAVMMFTIGATFSLILGVNSLTNPGEVHHSNFNFLILGIAALLESVALWLALRATWSELTQRGFWSAIRQTKDPIKYVVVLEDTAALIGITLAVTGLVLSQVFDVAAFDGVAAILIGLLLGGIALLLGYESRSLLLGEAVDRRTRNGILGVVQTHNAVVDIVDLKTMHLGPEEVLVGLEVELSVDLSSEDASTAVREIETLIQAYMPSATHIFVESVSSP